MAENSRNKWKKGFAGERLENSVQKCLQERVCEIFLMQDFNRRINNNNNNSCPISPPPFFRSPTFLHERIPQGLFSNGANGLLPTSNRSSESGGRGGNNIVGGTGSGSVVRNIPIRVLDTPDNLSKAKEQIFEQQSSSSTPERMDLSNSISSENILNKNFTPFSSPDLRRNFASLFWTPQQAKRIAEREQQKNVPIQQQQKREFIEDNNHYANSSKETNYNSLSRPTNTTNSSGFGNGSTVTFYSIPISQKEENEKNKKILEISNNKNKQQQNDKNNHHYSAIPFRRRIGGLLGSMSAISTPSLFHQREEEEEKPKSHYQNIDFFNSDKNKLKKEEEQQERSSNLPNNKLIENTSNNTKTTSQTTFPTNSNKLINETNVYQPNNNNYNNFPLQHSLRRTQTSGKQTFPTPNASNNNNSTQQIRNRSVEATDLSSRTGLTKTLPLLPRRDSEPSIVLFAAAESPQQFSEQKEKQSPIKNNISTNKMKKEKQNDEKTKIVSEDSSSLLSTTQSLESSSSCSASISASPLASSSSNTSKIQNNQSRQRIKSPSLAALRQSLLRYRPMRKSSNSSNTSGNNNEKDNANKGVNSSLPNKTKLEETTSLTSSDVSSSFSDTNSIKRLNEQKQQKQNFMSHSMFLTPSKLCLTKFTTNQNSENKGSNEKVDAVEEAIRSLEQFDPNEFVQYQYHQENENNNNINQNQQIIAIQSTTPQPKLYIAKTEQPIYLSQPYSCSVASPIVFERPSSLSSFSSLSSAIEDQQLVKGPPPSLPSMHRGTSTNTAFSSSSGSATPTQTATTFILDEPSSSSFNLSLDDNQNNNHNPPTNTTNTPRANSPTFDEDDEANEENNNEKIIVAPPTRRGVTFNDNLVQHFYAPFDGPPPDYSESGGDSGDDLDDDVYNAEELPDDEIDALDSVADSEEFYINNKIVPNSSTSAALEAKAQLRKRFLCSQLNDCAKVIEIGALKMGQFVNVSLEIGGWRQPHILRHNLGAIRDTIYTVEIALDELVETLGRISLHRRDPRQEHLRLLFQPCEYSLTLLRRLRSSLDSTGWLLSSLSRPRGSVVGHDALDQVVALLPQLPRDCAKLVQWVSSLSAWSDPQRSDQLPAAVFLPSSSNPKPQNRQQHSNNSLFPIPHFPLYRQPSPTSSLQNFYYSSSGGEEEMRDKNSKGLADIMDGGESTSSTTSSVQTALEQPPSQKPSKQQQKHQEQSLERDNNNIENTDLVLEEDDLASVLSVDSNTTTEGGHQQLSPPTRLGHFNNTGVLSSTLGICRVNAELARSLAPEQRDLFRIWEPQVETHIDTICTIIEQFFVLLEDNKEPTPAGFQKIQMVYIEGHSLVGIGRVICRDDVVLKHRPLNAFIEHECVKLDSLLNECLSNAKVAKSHTQANNQKQQSQQPQTVPAVRSMCKAVVSVSECVGHLRLFWRACCG
ncbi:hypothetical protein ACQ4LE_000277 [Meloidogyne hapla]